MVLPEIGTRVWAYVPNLRRSLFITVTAHRASKFWGTDDGGTRWAGLSRWEPAENSAPLGDEDVADAPAENSALLEDGGSSGGDAMADTPVENSTLLGDEDVADAPAENSALLGDGGSSGGDAMADTPAENSAPLGDEDVADAPAENSALLEDGGDDAAATEENSALLGDEDVAYAPAENSAPSADDGSSGGDGGDDDADDGSGGEVSAENSAPSADDDADDDSGVDDGFDLASLVPLGAAESGIIQVPIKYVRTDPEFQPRSQLDDFTIERYSSMIAYSDPPPVELWWIDDALWLIHGHHRLAAVRRAGRLTIPAIVKQGSRLAAIRAAMIANLANGLPLSRQSLESACKKYLAASPVSESSRSVARLFGIDEKTVRNYRKDLEVEEIVRCWQPGVTRLLLKGGTDSERPFYLGTYKGRCYGGG